MRDKNLRRMRIAIVTGAVAAGSIAAAVPAVAATTTATPACKAANLTVSLNKRIDPGAGQRYTTLDFTTKKTCVLRNGLARFTYAIPGKKGKVRNAPVHAYGDTGLGYGAKQTVVLKPGKKGKHGTVAHLVVHWNVVSVPGVTPKTLKFTLPAAGGSAGVKWNQLVGGDLRLGLGRLSG